MPVLASSSRGIGAPTTCGGGGLRAMGPGATTAIWGYSIQFVGAQEIPGPNYTADRGEFVISRDGQELTRMYPEKRSFPVQRQVTTEAAIRPTGFGDLYLVLGDDQGDGARAVRIYHN